MKALLPRPSSCYYWNVGVGVGVVVGGGAAAAVVVAALVSLLVIEALGFPNLLFSLVFLVSDPSTLFSSYEA